MGHSAHFSFSPCGRIFFQRVWISPDAFRLAGLPNRRRPR
ncbi:hypothetical protein SCATT_27100 [Streptantibioticus cattleyicolor NRRL 8057 = DSM 46488]|uniref:Uncharacterized protein n=1 Tax=Streptantibioticus cattleyicolor (strain ATCC 35852 / DSM 46488 / JCM 4925 / NBRC 14057 / NRRL 8057) TaxID=1003195 RepID=G8X2G5_STREN|nr:hypothetical protein SCATT_27100 [Streptantibioticus cattleyicolor NRRL 8057 = DSM 46488]